MTAVFEHVVREVARPKRESCTTSSTLASSSRSAVFGPRIFQPEIMGPRVSFGM